MPNLDGGHYFLTVLAPVQLGTTINPVDQQSRSHRHVLAQKLSLLRTGRQTAASLPNSPPSPFAANTLNHLARFVIIDDPAFNGRVSGDSLLSALRNVDPLVAQPVDRLTTPYLLFAADIDAPHGAEAGLRAYTDALWATMQPDLVHIFRHCIDFDAIDGADAFHRYILRCQVETTMPFNDYWPDKLGAEAWKLPAGPLVAAAITAVAALALWLVLLLANGILALAGAHGRFATLISTLATYGSIVIPLLILVALIAAYLLYRTVLRRGMLPFPTGPGSDLPSVLKALFLQQHFTQFAIEAQGLDDATLHTRFGSFLQAVRPSDPLPTQTPGEFRA